MYLVKFGFVGKKDLGGADFFAKIGGVGRDFFANTGGGRGRGAVGGE